MNVLKFDNDMAKFGQQFHQKNHVFNLPDLNSFLAYEPSNGQMLTSQWKFESLVLQLYQTANIFKIL